jgi:hypothetical protein
LLSEKWIFKFFPAVDPSLLEMVSAEFDGDELAATTPQNTEGKHFITTYIVMIHILGFFQQFTNYYSV